MEQAEMDLRQAMAEEVFNGTPLPEEMRATPAIEEKPDAEEVVEPKEVAEPKAEPKAEPEDPWAGVPSALRNKLDMIGSTLEQFTTRVKTAEGRVGAIQSELAKRAVADTKAAGSDAPTQRQIADAKDDESWKELKEDFPEWADAFEKRMNAQSDKFSGKFASKDDIGNALQSTRDEIRQELETKFNEQLEKRIVAIKHPGYESTLKTPEFWAWFQTQPEHIQVKGNSTMAEDAIEVLDAFKARNTPPPATVKEKREKRLSSSVPVAGVKETPIKSEDDMTPDELRAHIAKQVYGDRK